MKKIHMRSIVVYILSLFFIVGIVFFVFEFVYYGDNWAINPINSHLSGTDMANAGSIIDKEGNILASSTNGKREYNIDKDVRISLLHTIGDGSTNISTAIQNNFRAELFGYNIIVGLGMSSIMNTANDINLTLYSRLCKSASNKLGNRKGTVVFYNYNTGEIVCLVSKPSYDPYNKPSESKLNSEEYDGVYINRAISSSYTPGSTFKIISSVAGLNNIPNMEDVKYECNGVMEINGEKVTCMAKHGNIALKNAFAKSCNIYFANLAMDVGREKMNETANEMGFNKSFVVDNIPTKESYYDVSSAADVQLAWSGVGQYTNLVNPIHFMIIMGAIANNGIAAVPYILDFMKSQSMGFKFHNSSKKYTSRILSESNAQKLKEMMSYTTKNQYTSIFKGRDVCSKTGTAEVGEGKKPHGWIIGFSADKTLPLAFAVIVENAGYGISTAGVIASDIMNEAASFM